MRVIPRMTTRRWMVAVAAVALLCLLEHRRRSFASLAAYHESRRVIAVSILPPGDVLRYVKRAREWHAAMACKYRHAARYPWLPVETDPPRPEP